MDPPPPPFDPNILPPPMDNTLGLPPPAPNIEDLPDSPPGAAPNEYQNLPNFSNYDANADSLVLPAAPPSALPPPVSPRSSFSAPPPPSFEPGAPPSGLPRPSSAGLPGAEDGGDEDEFPPPDEPPPPFDAPPSFDASSFDPPPFDPDVVEAENDQYQTLPMQASGVSNPDESDAQPPPPSSAPMSGLAAAMLQTHTKPLPAGPPGAPARRQSARGPARLPPRGPGGPPGPARRRGPAPSVSRRGPPRPMTAPLVRGPAAQPPTSLGRTHAERNLSGPSPSMPPPTATQSLSPPSAHVPGHKRSNSGTSSGGSGVRGGNEMPTAPVSIYNGVEVFRPAGVCYDVLAGRNAAYEKKNKQRWCMLYRDRLDFSVNIPLQKGRDVPVKGSLPLQGCAIEMGKTAREVVFKDSKGKKKETLCCQTDQDAAQLYQFVRMVIARLPKASRRPKGKAPKVFGSSFDELLTWERYTDPDLAVPTIVVQCLEYLQSELAYKTEGIFRLSGSLTKILEYKALFDSWKPAEIQSATDPNVVSGVLKLWLREMPEPLLLFDNYDDFMRIAKSPPPDELAQYRAICESLPDDNLNLLRVLMWLCRDFADYEEDNKMSPQNLAIVFGPNLLKSASEDMMSAAEDSQYINELFKKIIVNPEAVVGPRELGRLRSEPSPVAESSPMAFNTAGSSGTFSTLEPKSNSVNFGSNNNSARFSSGAFGSEPDESTAALLRDLSALDPSNAGCADCGAHNPTSVSQNLGVLLCMECNLAHARALANQRTPRGSPVSVPVPIDILVERPALAEFVRRAAGNARVNAFLEASMPPNRKISPDTPDGLRQQFVLAKYAQSLFVDADMARATASANVTSLVQRSDVPQLLAAIFGGQADLNAMSPEGAAIHEAVRQGDIAIVALLALNGADPCAVAPAEGLSALDMTADPRIKKLLSWIVKELPGPADPPARSLPPKQEPMGIRGGVNMFGGAPPPARRPGGRGPSRAPARLGPGALAPGGAVPGRLPPAGRSRGLQRPQHMTTAAPSGRRGGGFTPPQFGQSAPSARTSMHQAAATPPAPVANARSSMHQGVAAPPASVAGARANMHQAAAAPPSAPSATAAATPTTTNPAYMDGDIDLTQFQWFHGKISSADAYKLLSPEQKGAYLMRCSSRPGNYVISWVSNEEGMIIHTLVTPRVGAPGYDIEGDKKSYLNIPEIVASYGKHLQKLILRSGPLV